MARSVCDVAAKPAGVCSDAELHSFSLEEGDSYLVLATDGLFEFVEDEEVAQMIRAVELEEGEGSVLHRAMDKLWSESCNRWEDREGVIDDTSIIIASVAAL
jgi:serine/threonine protein phosphatase PrpC